MVGPEEKQMPLHIRKEYFINEAKQVTSTYIADHENRSVRGTYVSRLEGIGGGGGQKSGAAMAVPIYMAPVLMSWMKIL